MDTPGLINDWLKESSAGAISLGTEIEGSVIERPLPDGRAEVTVLCHTRNANIGVAPLDDPFNVLFGNDPWALLAGEEPVLGDSFLKLVFITRKKLTLTGSPGTILQAWTGMSWRPGGPSYDLVWITTNADVVIRNIEVDGQCLAASMPNTSALLEAVVYYGASGRVENCVFRGFRGGNNLANPTTPPRGGMGFGMVAFGRVSTGSGVIHVQILNCTFSDTGDSMAFAGDFGPDGINDPTLLCTTFTVEGNTIAGIGPSSIGYQDGIQVYNGASGVIKNNRIIDHYYTRAGVFT